jgi:hypothetical protein
MKLNNGFPHLVKDVQTRSQSAVDLVKNVKIRAALNTLCNYFISI